MCTNGVNATQLNGAITQIDEAIALARRWTHRAYHSAEDGRLPKTAAQLKSAQALLDETRAAFEEALELLEREAAASPDVTVALV